MFSVQSVGKAKREQKKRQVCRFACVSAYLTNDREIKASPAGMESTEEGGKRGGRREHKDDYLISSHTVDGGQ